jgi:3-mercaptopyruvate sulfurtransferase SseA
MSMAPDKAYQLWREKSKEVVILDVRTPGEYQSGHVKGAMNVDYYVTSRLRCKSCPKTRFISYIVLRGAVAVKQPPL